MYAYTIINTHIFVCIPKYSYSQSINPKEIERCEDIKLSIEISNINDVDRIFYSYIIKHNKKYDYYLVKCQFKVIFNDSQYCPIVTSK